MTLDIGSDPQAKDDYDSLTVDDSGQFVLAQINEAKLAMEQSTSAKKVRDIHQGAVTRLQCLFLQDEQDRNYHRGILILNSLQRQRLDQLLRSGQS